LLILTRKLGEVINIGHEIKIRVLSIKGRQVRIGIEAPKNLEVHRQEVYERIVEENLQAAKNLEEGVSLAQAKKVSGLDHESVDSESNKPNEDVATADESEIDSSLTKTTKITLPKLLDKEEQ